MNRNYANFADFCMLTSGGQPWSLDMQRRSGNPALFAYVVNGVARLLTGQSAISERFRRAPDGVMIAEDEPHTELSSPAMVLLAMRFAKSRLLLDGQWRPDMLAVIEKSCPELSLAARGAVIEPTAAGHWALQLAAGSWIPSVDRGIGMEVDFARV